MVTELPLQTLFQNQNFIIDSCLQPTTLAVLRNEKIDLEEILESKSIWKAPLSENSVIDNWRSFLTTALINKLSSLPSQNISRKIYDLLNQPWNQQSHYLKTLIALSQRLADVSMLDIHLDLLDGGAVPLQMNEYCPWSALPFRPYHTEMSALLVLLTHLTQQEHLKTIVKRLASWHLNLLDSNFVPVRGLFVKEKDGSAGQHLMWNYLLFHSMSNLVGESKYEKASQVILQHIYQHFQDSPFVISPIFPLIEKMIEHSKIRNEIIEMPLQLSESILDPSMALVGIRKESSYVICTLHGNNTGLGSMRYEDVHIVNYGPQYLPLEECEGFGIEGNYLSEHGIRKSWIEVGKNSFSLQGCVRLIDQPLSTSSMGQLRGIWLETEQGFKNEQLTVTTNFLGFDGWDGVAFSFYVKAKRCAVESGMTLKPRSLNRYEGTVKPLALEGDKGIIHLVSSLEGTMQIIPLGGDNNFWGADFLVAYFLKSNEKKYIWTLNP